VSGGAGGRGHVAGEESGRSRDQKTSSRMAWASSGVAARASLTGLISPAVGLRAKLRR
jgi:hypothetical protein